MRGRVDDQVRADSGILLNVQHPVVVIALELTAEVDFTWVEGLQPCLQIPIAAADNLREGELQPRCSS